MHFSIPDILSRISYYKKLSPAGKEKFEKRVEQFIEEKEFEGRGNFEITKRVKVRIAAAAVQLTFGLENFLLKHFYKILIYPDTFYSPFSKTNNVGEVNLGGIIVLSNKALEEGWKNDFDSYNVALHEMAHALNFTDLLNKDIDPGFSGYFPKWYVTARKILNDKDHRARRFLRKYAGRNIQELFAVGIEHFFERPETFKKAAPELYKHYCYLLNQDPLNADYQLVFEDRMETSEEKPVFAIRSQPSKWILMTSIVPVMILGIFWGWDLGNFVFGLPILLGLVALAWGLFQLRKSVVIEVYRHQLVIIYPHRFFFGRRKEYPVEDIISLNYNDSERNGKDSGSGMFIKWYDKGKINRNFITVYTDFDSFFPLFKYQYEENDIAIKRNGEIFIPEKEPVLQQRPIWKKMLGVR